MVMKITWVVAWSELPPFTPSTPSLRKIGKLTNLILKSAPTSAYKLQFRSLHTTVTVTIVYAGDFIAWISGNSSSIDLLLVQANHLA